MSFFCTLTLVFSVYSTVIRNLVRTWYHDCPFGGTHHYNITFSFSLFCCYVPIMAWHSLKQKLKTPFAVECQKPLFHSFSTFVLTPKCVGGVPTQRICGCPLWFSACSLGWRSCSANKWMTMTKLTALLFFLSLLSLCTVKSPIWHQSSARK